MPRRFEDSPGQVDSALSAPVSQCGNVGAGSALFFGSSLADLRWHLLYLCFQNQKSCFGPGFGLYSIGFLALLKTLRELKAFGGSFSQAPVVALK
eukprot:6469976-Amphidinium_carterae.1